MGNSGAAGGGSWFDPAQMVQDMFVDTDFESHSHPDMEKMIQAADPGHVDHIGSKLARAATAIHKIGSDLKDHKDRVDWEGDAADSFRGWVTKMSSATLRLGDMSKDAGEWIQNAAQTLREVKRDMPAYSESSKSTLDSYLSAHPGGMLTLAKRQPSSSGKGVLTGPTQSDAYDASQKLTEDHGEAVRQMRKLAQSYSMSSTAMSGVQAPTFPPMPSNVMPPKPKDTGQYVGGQGSDQTGAPSGPKTLSAPAGTSGSAPASGVDGGGTGPKPGDHVSTHLSGGAAMPQAPAPTDAPPTPHAGASGGPTGFHAGAPAPVPPALGGTGGFGGGKGMFAGGRPPSASGMTGERPSTLGRGPAANVRAGGRMPGDHGNGIYGGRGSQNGAQSPRRIPRGTVVGAEETQGQQGRPAMGGRPGGGMGGAGVGGERPGVVGGRPLASRPGGTVGGPRERLGGVGERPFTPGGTGLAGTGTPEEGNAVQGRGSYAGGGLGGSSPMTSPGQGRGERRPGYLVEDEDSWVHGERGVVPPVID